jgi:glutathione peroxidase
MLLIMKLINPVLIIALTILFISSQRASADEPKAPAEAASPLAFVVKDIDGNDTDLAQFRGKVVMLVNVASKCGLTPQYAGLEKLYQEHKDQGLVIIGFPANDFKNQEPGTNLEIKQFCTGKYNVSFPMMSKVAVTGEEKHPLYKLLTESETAGEHAGEIKWNFTKFLIGRDGKIVARFEPKTTPQDPAVVEAVETALARQ